jgi:signal transduction histidine kinase
MSNSAAAARLEKLAQLHLLAMGFALLLILVGAWRVPDLAMAPLLLIVGVLAALNAGLLLFIRRRGALELSERITAAITHTQVLLDIIGLTLLLYFAGGSENPFFPFYVFPVILAAALLGRRAGYAYSALSVALYAGMLTAEALLLLPHHHLIGLHPPARPVNPTLLLAQSVSLLATCLAAAAVTTLLVEALESRAAELAESRQRAEIRAANMHELNDQLRRANEECRHQREHLDAAYLELQRAHDRLSVRSSQLSDLNEQLRRANAECKDRRSELERLNAELERANQKLRELEDIRAQFTLLTTHELRAPVAAIQSYLKLILEGYVPEEKMHETLAKAERRAMDQLALIADLLELGRIGSADARGQVQPVPVDVLLREQAELLSAGARERNIALDLRIEPGLPPVLANPDQVKSLWNNLISNAIKYNRDSGRVEVTLRREGDRVIAGISDTGIGIPPEAMGRLFSEFFRADNAKAHSRSGTGLGLSIVQEIVERAGGKITAESELNKGTTFHFWLPALTSRTGPEPPSDEEVDLGEASHVATPATTATPPAA